MMKLGIASVDITPSEPMLLRGYAAVSTDGGIVSSVNDIGLDQQIDVTMADGVLNCRVLDKKVDNHG